MKNKYIIANWKMNCGFEESEIWLENFLANYQNKKHSQNPEIVICPSFILIENILANIMDYAIEKTNDDISKKNKKPQDFDEYEISEMIFENKFLSVGAQDCHFEDLGAFTGDVSAKTLVELGVEYVILGHSERRKNYFEKSAAIAKKVANASKNELVPILCVGENDEIRNSKKHLEFVYQQLLKSMPQDVKIPKLIIAYEPVWSIGTGIVPEVSQIAEMANLIRKICDEKLVGVADEFAILYGGSVSSKNAGEILKIKNIDGLLVGGASLKAEEFFAICEKAA